MTTLIYDGTYAGWLTAVFNIYEYKWKDVLFAKQEVIANFLFAVSQPVITNEEKAGRVQRGLEQRLSPEGVKQIYKAFFSEVERTEEMLWKYVKYVFDSNQSVEEDFANPAVWAVKQAAKRVKRESHRMEAFVRFQLTKDGLYYAVIEPDCNVLPLITDHFESRYADQRWLIYDARRKYGIYYDLEKVEWVELYFNHNASTRTIAEISDEKEEVYQDLWRRYFNSVNIPSRKNLKLHLQHMPKRYWKYLTEKVSSN